MTNSIGNVPMSQNNGRNILTREGRWMLGPTGYVAAGPVITVSTNFGHDSAAINSWNGSYISVANLGGSVSGTA